VLDKDLEEGLICNIMHIVSQWRTDDSLEMTSSILRMFADPRRLRILLVLLKQELCVCELVDTLLLPQYEVSRHLASLKKAGLVEDRREGLWAYYSVPRSVRKEPIRGRLLELLNQQLARNAAMADDFRRLEKRLERRVGGVCAIGFRT